MTRRPARRSPSSRSLSDASSPSAPNARTRAAASSTANGSPSRRWQITPTDRVRLRADLLPGVGGAAQEQVDGAAGTRDADGQRAGPATPALRRRRAVGGSSPAPPPTTSWRRIVATMSAAASRTCSQLSTTIKPRSPPSTARSNSSDRGTAPSRAGPAPGTPPVATPDGRLTGARSTNHTSSERFAATVWATSSATLVLPTPPGPTNVISPGAATASPSRS